MIRESRYQFGPAFLEDALPKIIHLLQFFLFLFIKNRESSTNLDKRVCENSVAKNLMVPLGTKSRRCRCFSVRLPEY